MSKNTNLSFLTDFLTADIVNSRVGMNNASPQSTFDVTGTGKFSGVLTLGSTVSNGTYTYTLPSATGTLALTSDIPSVSGYVPYTGAAASVNLGVYSITANAINSAGSGSTAGQINLRSDAFFSLVNGYGSIASGTTNQFNLYQTTGAGVFRGAILSLNSITESATRTFTFPDASGTIALTSSIPANPVGGTGTTNFLPKFTGTSTIGNSLVYDNGTNVGINTATPLAKLSVKLATATAVSTIANTTGWDSTYVVFGNPDSVTGQGFGISVNNTLAGVNLVSVGPLSDWVDTNYYSRNHIFYGGGTEKMRLDASGNLGLGVTPSAWENGSQAFQNSNYALTNFGLTRNAFWNGASWNYMTSDVAARFDVGNGAFRWNIAPSNIGVISFTQAMALTSGGNLLVGTTTDNGARLQVSGRTQISGGSLDFSTLTDLGIVSALTTGRSGTYQSNSLASISTRGDASSIELIAGVTSGFYTGISATANNASTFTGVLRLLTDGSERMRITSGGNVLIGTTTDNGFKFDVAGTGRFNGNALTVSGSNPSLTLTTSDSTLYSYVALNAGTASNVIYTLANSYVTTGPYIAGALALDGTTSAGISIAATNASGLIRFYTGGTTEKMRITSAGEVQIQTNSSSGVAGTNFRVYALDSDSFFRLGNNTSNSLNIQLTRSNTDTMFSVDGHTGAGYLAASAWSYGSDIRLKENVEYISNGLDKILSLKPAKFDYINGLKNNIGWIAQDVQEVIPEAVNVISEEDDQLTLKSDFIVPYLVKAIQEQQEQIQKLKNKLS